MHDLTAQFSVGEPGETPRVQDTTCPVTKPRSRHGPRCRIVSMALHQTHVTTVQAGPRSPLAKMGQRLDYKSDSPTLGVGQGAKGPVAMPALDMPKNSADPRPIDSEEPQGSGLCVSLLGGFQVAIDGRLVDDRAWRRRKAANLVKLLALAPRHRMHREAVLEHLWPEHDPGASSANLRVVLHAARRALQPAERQWQPSLQIVNDEIVLQVDGQPWIDIEEFERNAANAERTRNVADYRLALDLYTGSCFRGIDTRTGPPGGASGFTISISRY